MSDDLTDEQGRLGDGDTTASGDELWPGDSGTLAEDARRAFLALVKGPFLARRRQTNLWSALLRDETAIRRRLHDLFLDLIVDLPAEVAFVRNIPAAEKDLPKSVRSTPLTFLDTGLLLILRQHLLDADRSDRVIVGKDEIFEQLEIYRDANTVDSAAFLRRMNASWKNMRDNGLLAVVSVEDDRVEISPVLRLVFGPDEIAAVRDEYRRITARRPSELVSEFNQAVPTTPHDLLPDPEEDFQ